MRIAPTWRVYLLGATLCIALTVCSRNFGDRGGPQFMVSLAVAAIAYLLAVRELFVSPQFSRDIVIVGLVLAAVWHIGFLRVPPQPDEDIYRYVWDGRLQRLGYNPYLIIPNDPAAKELHTPETSRLNNPDLPSPYPAGAQLFFRAVTTIHESTFALKVAFVICDLVIVLLLLHILQYSRHGTHLVLVYAWNPLLAIEVAGSGHIDIVGVLFLLVSAAALMRRWRTTAAIAFGMAVAVKFLPIVLVPIYWKRVRIRDVALAAALIGLLYVPFLNHGHIPIGSLGAYVQSWRFNGPVFAVLSGLVPPRLLAALAVFAGLATATWLRNAASEWSPGTFVWPMAAALLCAPAVFPWYLLWLLPFLTSPSTLPIIVWTVSIILTYVVWHQRILGQAWGSVPGWVMLLEYGCVAVVGGIIWLLRGKGGTRALSDEV